MFSLTLRLLVREYHELYSLFDQSMEEHDKIQGFFEIKQFIFKWIQSIEITDLNER
jgi:hypothetical protein